MRHSDGREDAPNNTCNTGGSGGICAPDAIFSLNPLASICNYPKIARRV